MLIHEPNVSTKSITSPECDTRLNDCQNLDSIWMQVRLSKRWLSHVLSWRGVVDEISVQCINYYGGDGPFIYTSLCRCRLNLISNRVPTTVRKILVLHPKLRRPLRPLRTASQDRNTIRF